MDVLYRGFDGLDVAFAAIAPEDFAEALERAQAEAIETRGDVLLEHRGVKMHVADSGAKGGYAFRCDTGSDGATWFFKRPNKRDPWGVRVSVKALALALYGLGGVRARLLGFLDRLGFETRADGISVGRVDYAVDLLMPGFVLEPEHFVMHSHTTRRDHREVIPMVQHGCSGRVTSITIGKMPGRQVIVYDKRADVIAKRKVEWWEIWNDGRRRAGKTELDRKEQENSQVWRVELRAGKKHLKDRWGITTFADLDDKVGDLFQRAITDVRYVQPTSDTNRARWPNDPLWNTIGREVTGDLFEMACQAEPGAVREVIRKDHRELLSKQLFGLTASWGIASDYGFDQFREVLHEAYKELRRMDRKAPEQGEQKMANSAARYAFL